ncbi:MAG: hypothetical protein Q9200_003530 [Gallowayella weberi]
MCEALERLRPEGLVAWDRAVADGLTKTKRMERLKVSIYVEESYDREWNTTISKSLHYMLDVGKPAELERLDDNEPVQNAADEIVLVVFTSGTTDQPKACPHTGIDLSAATYTYARWRALGQPIHTQIVGIPDDLAGEVPVTVIVPKTREEIPTVSVLQEKVRPECGVDYVPARVNHHAASNEEKGNSTLQVLTSILARLLGRHQTDIPFSTSINQFADSITLVRLRSEVKRRLDKYIPDDLLTHKGGLQTLANQLGHGKPDTVLVHQKETAQTRGPPSSDDMIHVGESLNKFRGTQSAIELVLEQFRLSYETDVQSVFPVPDLSHKHLTRTKDYSYNLRSTMLVTRAHISQVREAIEATLVDWAVFRCIAVDYSKDQRLFVEIRCGANKLSKALWPAQRAPEWYIGNDIGWKELNGTFGQPTKRHHTDTSHQHINLNGIEQSVHLPNLSKLYPQAKVSAAVLFKAALALLTLDQTGENAALIGSVQAARQ